MIIVKDKTLIFIPYQDSDNFLSEGILTREFAMLYLFWNLGYRKVINIKKPRTVLDRKGYLVLEEYFPDDTVEMAVKKIIENSQTIQYLPWFNLSQILKRRGWWEAGYRETIKQVNINIDEEYIIYSDNPFAVDLLHHLRGNGGRLYFDMMDNFAIHPSLSERERKIALEGYKKIFTFSDYLSANSKQTCDYMRNYTSKEILLVKNGVFEKNEMKNNFELSSIQLIRKKKKGFKKCVGYIGKLGLRLDEKLIDSISQSCRDILFVFVGDYLKGQINNKLLKLFHERENVLHINAIPSAYVYPVLNEFDILSIPHAVGKNENGGDPLKLYQYMTRKKPIITTPILGVEEFKEYIYIESSAFGWIDCLNENMKACQIDVKQFTWETRTRQLFENCMSN